MKKQVFLQLLIAVAACFLAVFVFMYVDAVQSGTTVDKIFATWCTLFAPKGLVDVRALLLALTSMEDWLLLIVAFLFLFGIPAFFTRKKDELQMLSFTWLVGILAIFAGNFYTRSMSCGYLLFMFVLLLLGTGIQAMFSKSVINKEEVIKEIIKEVNKDIKREERKPMVESEIKKDIKFIENPLPLPKKHIKKKMDYKKEVTSDQMCYDIEVPETDDFDL